MVDSLKEVARSRFYIVAPAIDFDLSNTIESWPKRLFSQPHYSVHYKN